MQNPDLILIDGSSYLYRAFYVPQLKRMTTKSGQPTGAVFGILNMIKSLMSDYPDSTIVAVFDAKGKNFRHDLYPDYKANRPPMPDELRSQVDFVHEGVKAMGIPLIAITGVEADDVLATYANHATESSKTVLIATGDKDMAQVVNQKTSLIDTMKKVIYDEQGVVEKYGVRADQIVDYLTLIGDTSDNVPGVPKVGPKTAVKWLTEYGSLDEIIANAEKIGGKVGENLRAFLPEIPLSKELVTVKRDLSLTPTCDELKNTDQNEKTLIELFTKLEFKKWLSEMGQDLATPSSPVNIVGEFKPGNYETIFTQQAFDEWLNKLANSEGFAFDTETTSLQAQSAELVGVSFAIDSGHAAYVPLAHSYMGAPDQLDRDWVLSQLKPLLEDPNLPKIGQNLKYDMSVLSNYEIKLQGIYDTMLASYSLDSVASRHDMDTLSEKHLGHTPVSFKEIAGKGKAQLTFDQVEIDQASNYAAEDADITLRLHHALMPALTQQPMLHRVYTEIEIPLVPILSKIEDNGVLIDDAMLLQQSQKLASQMVGMEQQAYEIAGGDFNLSSPKQIQAILYEKLDLPITKKTKGGQPSTDEETLQKLAEEHDLPRLILEHRSLGKLKSTYTDKLPTMINSKTGRVHTSYHQAVTATGRLSSSDPNLQNIPIRTEEGRRIREAFIARQGNVIMAADYSQIELRIMAHLSGDDGLVSAFQNGLDVHSATAAEIFELEPDEVSSEQRRHAKAVNFGLIYGMSAFGLAKQLHVERKQAQHYIEQYFNRYPGVHDYMEQTRELAREQGYVETVFGRRLYLPDINAKNHQQRQYAERTAINAPMQGTAADIIKLAMIAVDDYLLKQQPDCQMIMQVHDELVFELAANKVEQVSASICELMQNVTELKVPLLVEAGVGENWSAAH